MREQADFGNKKELQQNGNRNEKSYNPDEPALPML
jgi:hypothetical protein